MNYLQISGGWDYSCIFCFDSKLQLALVVWILEVAQSLKKIFFILLK
jgi:hypothetical protein